MTGRHAGGAAPVGHDHAPAPAVVRGRRLLLLTCLLLGLSVLAGLVLLRPDGSRLTADIPQQGERVKATVVGATQVPCGEAVLSGEPAPSRQCLDLRVRVDEGPDSGAVVVQEGGSNATGAAGVGDRVVLIRTPQDVPLEERYQLSDTQRGLSLTLLALLFAVAVIALGRVRGLLALVGLAASLVVLVGWLVPALLDGRPPLLTATVGAGAVMLVVLLLAHGPSLRTATAVVGTALALLLTLALGAVFVRVASLTGQTSDDATYVKALFGELDLRGLLLAGVVIGALGILDDVTVTQVSTVYELRAADPSMPGRTLYAAALRVGRDHVASLVNTLLLAYAGASLPLLVVFTTSGEGLVSTLTNGVVAEEVVRTLVGSIGLVAAVPITTALAAATCPPTRGLRSEPGGGSEVGGPGAVVDVPPEARRGG